MKHQTTLAVAVLLQILCGGVWGGCKRAFKTTEVYTDDCSTVTVPCLVYTGGVGAQLETPDSNTRTCYRTCHDDNDMYDPATCEASLTGVHNQNIQSSEVPISSTTNITSRTIFSPNFNDPKDYRKSTICRYNVTCEEGELLAYIFLNHTLENATDICITGPDTCVDYVEVSLEGSTTSEKTCGEDAPVGQVIADGYSAAFVEFFANREEQAAGFKMNLMCYDPTINVSSLPTSKRSVEEEAAAERDNLQQETCVEVTPGVRREVNSVQHLREVFNELDGAREDLSPENIERCTKVTVRELETLQFEQRKLMVTKTRRKEVFMVDRVAEDISRLAVSTRFRRSKVFENNGRSIQGYARLFVCEDRAYVDRLGIKPEDRPTPEETDIIFRLRMAVSKARECDDFFDVYDKLDAAEERVTIFEESHCERHFRRDRALDRLARNYSRACNIFLRSAACAYKAAILKEYCY